MRGKHFYVTGANAMEVIEAALDQREEMIKEEARSKAFKDCTIMWANEIKKINDAGGTQEEKLSRIMHMFSVGKDGEDI